MINDIKAIYIPEYANIVSATATMTDMGDKTITLQVKVDGGIVPDFSRDWEIEFHGERYIQPLREPQASKGNESIYSAIDLTFYHKGIYDVKRYFFVSMAEVSAGTVMADNYIVPLRLNLREFGIALQDVLNYYFPNTYTVSINEDYAIEESDKKDIDINYTKIWNVIMQIHELYDVRWSIYTREDGTFAIDIGYPSTEVSHIFEYGFEGGLLKFEHQVQDSEIANKVFGRGSSENIPFRYFKKKDDNNPTFDADPDWIPELEHIYFANLRGKTFRDYVKGWKAKHYGGEPMNEPTEEYLKGYNDEKFAPIEYVEDKESIAKYGEIQKGLEHNESIKPSIQGVSLDGIGRVDEVVDVEPILVDESTNNTEWESKVIDIEGTSRETTSSVNQSRSYDVLSPTYIVPDGYQGSFIRDYVIDAIEHINCTNKYWHTHKPQTNPFEERKVSIEHNLKYKVNSIKVINADTTEEITDLIEIKGGTRLFVLANISVSDFYEAEARREVANYPVYGYTSIVEQVLYNTCVVDISFSWQLDYTPIHGQIIGNYESGATRKSKSITIPANGTSQVTFTTEQFTILDSDAPATNVDMPIRITSSMKGGEYDSRPNVVAINVDTNEQISTINLPAGTYYLQNSVQIINLASQAQTFKVELLPSYIYYSYDSSNWKPTFDIWVKNIWQSEREPDESYESYANRVWTPILGASDGSEAKVVFSSGWLSGYSDWEFTIARTPVYDASKVLDGVRSEWRITLHKSDAEMETTNKWLPSTKTQANAGDYFYFTGIDLPHQYVLWAEDRLDKYKREELYKVANIKPIIVIQTDKVRLNDDARLIDSLRVGNSIRVADVRFIKSEYEELHLESITYTWDSNTIMFPNVEVVLAEKRKEKNVITEAKDAIKGFNDKVKEATDNLVVLRNKTDFSIKKSNDNASEINRSNAQISTIASDRQLYRNEHTFVVSDSQSIEDEYKELAAEYQIMQDEQGLVYRDSLGRVFRVRSANVAFTRYSNAFKAYSSALNAVINSKGIANITPDFTNAEREYYDARAELSKAISIGTKKKIADLDYLKDAFGADNVMDSNGVVLSQLVSVKNANGDVVAGIYGGANENLNNGGFKDRTHGALMQFAGASSAQDVANAKYRVYEDGTLFAESGVFGGLIKRSPKIITPSNYTSYSNISKMLLCGLTKNKACIIDVVSAGSMLVFDGMRNDFVWSNIINAIEFDVYDPNTNTNVFPLPSGKATLEDMLQLVGSQIILYFKRGNFEGISLEDKMLNEGILEGSSCWKVEAGDILVATCIMQTGGGKKAIFWKYEKY